MSWVGVVTNAGRDLFARYALGGMTLEVDGLKAGKGAVAQTDMRAATALDDEVADGNVGAKVPVTGGVQYRLEVGPAESATYNLTEMGLFVTATYGGTTETVMVAYMEEVNGGIPIPLEANFPDFVYVLISTLVNTNDEDISLTINPLAYVPYSVFNQLVANVTEIRSAFASIGLAVMNDKFYIDPVTE